MCLRWVILNVARSGEARNLRWDYIDIEKETVRIPKPKMKGRREHRIPYSTASKELLDAMWAVRVGNLVFPSNGTDRPLSENVLADQAKRIMPEIKLTAHGFRTSFREWARETTDFTNEMIETALSHQISTKVEQAYQRGDLLDKRCDMMNVWGQYCQTGKIDPQYRTKYARNKLAAAAD
jgi:integrase